MIPVRITTKTKKLQSLMRSASAPETIEAAVATNTIWKNQSEPAEYSPPSSASAAGAAPASQNSERPPKYGLAPP